MKFMVIASMKDAAATVPATTLGTLWEANVEHVDKAMKAGKILQGYSTAGWGRTITIEEHSSHEELQRQLSTSPLGMFINFEVYPLVSWEESVNLIREMLKSAGK